ncbi:MAG: flagellar biosynthetic protein FliQ [Natronospirillum sp.]|uniref:flagellar biosynthetic protein FliQ n=1 Tax=Natronospirillum sp. TaxID=2812955 RepID=UPI00260013D1|nr:flagellar biosynthetic protein FliQ [Natronospirillum sp.]MCH8551285.1 flagellar biosynthetic protein FliQ [Natronospirillum sp.]
MGAIYIGDLFREALFLVFMCVSVLIVPSLLVGLVVATFQAATQINEQTLSFLPRLLVTLMSVIIAGPWLTTRVVDFARRLYMDIPFLLS